MSKRFVLHASQNEIEDYFSAEGDAGLNISSDYNISAGAIQPIIIEKEGEHKIKQAKWGLIPPNADDEREGRDNCLFKLEDMKEDDWPANLIETRRTLIPASGFYKWKSIENQSTPFYVRMLASDIMPLAGIYTRWESESGRKIYSFAILTTQANALVEPIDDRMPLVIQPQSFTDWLNEEVPSAEILKEIDEYSSMLTKMIVNRVTEEVNDINNNGAELIQPIPK